MAGAPLQLFRGAESVRTAVVVQVDAEAAVAATAEGARGGTGAVRLRGSRQSRRAARVRKWAPLRRRRAGSRP